VDGVIVFVSVLPQNAAIASEYPLVEDGSDTTYFSAAHAPRSINRQRSEQNGKSASVAESVGFLQIGHRCFMVKKYLYHFLGLTCSASRLALLPGDECLAGKMPALPDYPQRRAVAILVNFSGRDFRFARGHRTDRLSRLNFDDAADQVIRVRLGDFNATTSPDAATSPSGNSMSVR